MAVVDGFSRTFELFFSNLGFKHDAVEVGENIQKIFTCIG